jgi:signal transduction histidine kinase
MVNDMLNISRIESGRLTLNIQAVSIDKLVQEVIDDVQPRAQELGVHVSLQMTEPPPPVLADSDKIKEVVFNLVGNSLKFTPKDGNIVVTFNVTETMVEVKIKDTGSGIEAEDLPKLFQKFGLLPGSYVTNQAALGTGLGLYICKSIIELHEGKITASSEGRSKGAEFVFSLKIFNEQDLQRLSAKFAHESSNAVELIHSQI